MASTINRVPSRRAVRANLARIENAVVVIRGERVMLDIDLARLYGVTTKALNQAVRRNANRFPDDFMLQLTEAELAELNRSQNVTGSQKHRDPRFPPFAFTEQGVAMLSGVLRSTRAVEANIEIMRVFVRLRKLVLSHSELSAELTKLEQSVTRHDRQIRAIFEAIQQLISPATAKAKQIGFRARSSTR
jgi:ORF6N domain